MAYADTQQLAEYLGEPAPPDAATLLERASEVIDGLLRAAVYETDSSGVPTDTNVQDALARATCAQVAYWLETGDVTGAGSRWQSVSIGSTSMSRAGGVSSAHEVPTAPHAVTILRNAGLLPGRVIHR